MLELSYDQSTVKSQRLAVSSQQLYCFSQLIIYQLFYVNYPMILSFYYIEFPCKSQILRLLLYHSNVGHMISITMIFYSDIFSHISSINMVFCIKVLGHMLSINIVFFHVIILSYMSSISMIFYYVILIQVQKC